MKYLNPIPPIYSAPTGFPLNWRMEQSGQLEEAVKTYWLFKTNNQETAPTEHQIFLIKCYLEHYINAPCWQEDSKINLQKLRSTVSSINSIDDIHAWLKNAMEIALDPL